MGFGTQAAFKPQECVCPLVSDSQCPPVAKLLQQKCADPLRQCIETSRTLPVTEKTMLLSLIPSLSTNFFAWK